MRTSSAGDGAAPLLEVCSVSRWFGSGRGGTRQSALRALDEVSLTLNRGEILGIAGESGAGKSTLARLITRVLAPDSGEIRLDGTPLQDIGRARQRETRRRIQPIFQDPSSALSPRRTVGQSLYEPLAHFRICRRDQRQQRVIRALAQTGLDAAVLDRLPHQLSTGQKQRVCIARALLAEPDVIVADEPVSALDVSVQAQIIDLLRGLHQETGLAVLLISHDLAVIAQLASRVGIMLQGQLVEMAPTRELITNPAHPYTRRLIEAVPDPDPSRLKPGRSAPPPERPGSGRPLPPGCPYFPVCPEAMERCREERPGMRRAGSGIHDVKCHLYPPRGNNGN